MPKNLEYCCKKIQWCEDNYYTIALKQWCDRKPIYEHLEKMNETCQYRYDIYTDYSPWYYDNREKDYCHIGTKEYLCNTCQQNLDELRHLTNEYQEKEKSYKALIMIDDDDSDDDILMRKIDKIKKEISHLKELILSNNS